MNRTRVTASVCAGVLGLALAACHGPKPVDFPAGSTMDRLHKAGRITVGVKYDQPGVGFRNLATGNLEGFDIRMTEIVAAELGLRRRQIHYVETVSKDREPFLQNDRVDIVIASYSITPDRQRFVGQAGPYYVTGQQLLVRTEDKEQITGPDKLAGVRVCSVTRSTSIATVQKPKYKAETVALSTYTECVRQLLNGKVAAVTTDYAILSVYAAQQPDKLAVVGPPFNVESYGIGYKRGDLDFCRFLTATIEKAENSGAWDEAFKDTLGKAGVEIPEKPTPEPCRT
jgi:glutamate transport system substrate-binding protein